MAASGIIVYMRTIPERPDNRVLTYPLPCKNYDGSDGFVPEGFESDGASSGIFEPIFPRHKHPIAYFRHDWRCQNARSAAERKWADKEYREDVGRTSWWITKQLGYIGVRVGAMLGVGVHY